MSGMTWMWEVCAKLGGGETLGALGESWLHAAIARVITVAAAQRFTDSSWIGWMTGVQLRCQGDGGQLCGRNVDRARQVGRDSHGTAYVRDGEGAHGAALVMPGKPGHDM